jgi:hypothetical protein
MRLQFLLQRLGLDELDTQAQIAQKLDHSAHVLVPNVNTSRVYSKLSVLQDVNLAVSPGTIP